MKFNSGSNRASNCKSVITDKYRIPTGKPAPVEVYDEENNSWSIVKQEHIPPNELGAVEIEGGGGGWGVYFIINKFQLTVASEFQQKR